MDNPDHALAHLNLAIVYAAQSKDKEKALYHFNRCISINPNLPQLKMVKKRFLTLTN
jgi:tetratricopeptide (TPR) repeat protein